MHRHWQVALLVALATAGCSDPDPAALVESGRRHLEQGQARRSVIELKSAVQYLPQSAPARHALGQALLATGDPASAAEQFRKALALGQARDAVLPLLASALLAAGQPEPLVRELGDQSLSDPAAEAELRTLVARAHHGLGQFGPAHRALDAALAARPAPAGARVLRARVLADEGRVGDGLKTLDDHLAGTPRDADGWRVRGDLLARGRHDLEAALASYRRALEVDPGHVPAHTGAITLLLDRHDVAAAHEQLALLQRVRAAHPQTLYLAAKVALARRALEQAQGLAARLLTSAPGHPPYLELAGEVAVARGQWVQAELHLLKALQAAPSSDSTRRLLARTHLQRAEPYRALKLLQALVTRPAPDAADLALKAQAHHMAGEQTAYASALDTLGEARLPADTVTPKAGGRVLPSSKGGSTTASPRPPAAPPDATADLRRIVERLRRQEHAQAMEAIDELARRQPTSPVVATLRGQAWLLQGQRAAAARAFEAALLLAPDHLPAAIGLARLDLAAGQVARALERMDAVVDADPMNTRATIARAELRQRTGASTADIIRLLGDGVRQAPGDPARRIALIDYALWRGELSTALDAARAASQTFPTHAPVLAALERARNAAGRPVAASPRS